MIPTILDVGVAKLAVVDTGAGSTAIVFLHYWGSTARTWSGVVERLAPRHRCVAIDQRGWGASRGTTATYGLDEMADDAVTLAAKLGLDRFVVVGHSMGGKIAQIAAARRPPGLVGMVLLAPAPLSPLPASAEQRGAMAASYTTAEGVRQALQILTAHGLDTRLEKQVIDDTLEGEPDAKLAWTSGGMIADHSAAAECIDVPTLILVGEEDRVEPPARMRADVAMKIGGAQLQVLPRCGHLLPLEEPQAVADAIERFVATLPRGKAGSN